MCTYIGIFILSVFFITLSAIISGLYVMLIGNIVAKYQSNISKTLFITGFIMAIISIMFNLILVQFDASLNNNDIILHIVL